MIAAAATKVLTATPVAKTRVGNECITFGGFLLVTASIKFCLPNIAQFCSPTPTQFHPRPTTQMSQMSQIRSTPPIRRSYCSRSQKPPTGMAIPSHDRRCLIEHSSSA